MSEDPTATDQMDEDPHPPPDADNPDRADEPDVAFDETDDHTGEQPEDGE